MKKLLLLAVSAALCMSAVAHDIPGFTVAQNLTASTIEVPANAGNGKALWIVPLGINIANGKMMTAKYQQFFGTRYSDNSTSYEAGMFNLPDGVEYAAVWDSRITKATDFQTKDFSRLDLNNVKVTLTTGANIKITKNKMTREVVAQNVKVDYVANPHVTATLFIYSVPDEGGNVYTATLDYGLCADDLMQAYEYLPQTVGVDTPDGKMFANIGSMKLLFENVVTGEDFVALRKTEFPSLHEWIEPTVSLSTQVGDHNVGEIRLQAEDFDGPSYGDNGEVIPAHSNTAPVNNQADGYGYDSRKFDETCQNIRIHINDESGTKGFYLWQEGNASTVNGLGFALVNFAQQEWNAAYGGPLQEDGTATLDDLADFYGAWTEYTVNAEEDMYWDLSLRVGLHNVNYAAYRAGNAKCPNVTGENVNYFTKYGGAYRVYVDGEPIRAAWSIRPPVSVKEMSDWTNWLENLDPEQLNVRAVSPDATSYFVYAMPDITHSFGNDDMGTVWNAQYKHEIFDQLYDEGKLTGENAEATKTIMQVPDYTNIPIKAGKHTIKVQAMGGRTTFDEIKVQAHPEPNTTGIDVPAVNGVWSDADADAPVEYYNLQGVKVVNPQGGIFIRKQGSKVSKVVVR